MNYQQPQSNFYNGQSNDSYNGQSNDLYNGQSFISGGRRCRVVCDNPPRPGPGPDNQYLRSIARRIIGQRFNDASRIYPLIRVAIRDGQNLPLTQDYNPRRINVETRNGVIRRIVNFG
jgi:hypothetical protein